MSRSYNFAVELSPVTEDDIHYVCALVECELGAHEIHSYFYEKTLYLDGCTTLCGGESDEDADYRLVEHIKKMCPEITKIITKWLCTEYQEWDETYTWNKDDDNE